MAHKRPGLKFRRFLALVVVIAGLWCCPTAGVAQVQDSARKVIAKTAPTYPELARKIHLTGKVKIEIVIRPSGSVASAKLVGGSPVFEQSAVDAVKQWKFEAASKETTEVIVLEFADR